MPPTARTAAALACTLTLAALSPRFAHATGACAGTATVTQSNSLKSITVKTTDNPICLRISEAAGTLSFVPDPPGTTVVGGLKALAGVTKITVKLSNHRDMLTLSTLAIPGVDLVVKGRDGGNFIVMDGVEVRKLTLDGGKSEDNVDAADVTVERKSRISGGPGDSDRFTVVGELVGPIDVKNFEEIRP